MSAAAGTASTPQGDGTAPSSVAMATKMVAFMASRAPIHRIQPPNTSPGRSGVAAAPWNVRIHFIPPITGHSDSSGGSLHGAGGEDAGSDESQVVDPAHRRRVLVDQAAEAEADRAEEHQRHEDEGQCRASPEAAPQTGLAFRDAEHGHRRRQRVER